MVDWSTMIWGNSAGNDIHALAEIGFGMVAKAPKPFTNDLVKPTISPFLVVMNAHVCI